MAIPLSQSTELPPGRTGQVKPEFAVDTGATDLAFTGARLAGDIARILIDSDASNSVDEFEGVAKAAQIEFTNKVRNNPGASEQDYQQWQEEMLADIRKSGAKTKGKARRLIESWYKKNEKSIIESAEAQRDAIRLDRELERTERNMSDAVNRRDVQRIINIGNEAKQNDLWNAEQAEARVQEETKKVAGNDAIDVALTMEPEKANEFLDSINQNTRDNYQIEGDLYSDNEIEQLKSQYETQRKAIEADVINTNKSLVLEATNEHQKAIIGGDTGQARIDAINSDDRFLSDPTKARTLISLLESRHDADIARANELGGKEDYTPQELLANNTEIQTAIRDRNPKTLDIISRLAGSLTNSPDTSATKASGYADTFINLQGTSQNQAQKYNINIVDDLERAAIAVIEPELKKEDPKKYQERVRDAAVLAADRKNQIDAIYNDTSLTPQEQDTRAKAVIKPAQDAAAKEVVKNIWLNRFLWVFPQTSGIMQTRHLLKKFVFDKNESTALEGVRGLSDEELDKAIEEAGG